MTDDNDEPLEGDIGPAPSVRAPAPGEPRDREDPRRAGQVSGRIALIAVAVLLAFLAYDSVTTALEAHQRGGPWIYPPATIAAVCLSALSALAIRTFRRR